jgi:tetratricopeptide repeat protein
MSVELFDLHDEAYYIWRDRGVRGAVLVHVDSHADAAPADPSRPPDIGNYVRAAVTAGIVSNVFWVVPDTMWHDPPRRALVDRVLAEAGALPIEAGPLEALPVFEQAVLLDVDIDFFFITGHDEDATQVRRAEPWCAAADLGGVLNTRCRRRLVTTIATSLTGCFTPMEWQHLGAEMAAVLEGAAVDPAVTAAARFYREALRLQAGGDVATARAAFARAVEGDATYRHPFRTSGHVYRQLGRVEAARVCFQSSLALDPADPWARLGLAMLAGRSGLAQEALAALPVDVPTPGALEWWRTRAVALTQLGDLPPAIEAYTRVLSLAAAGAVPLRLRMCNRDRRLVDPRHWRDHAAIGSLLRRAGDAAGGAAHERIARAAGVVTENADATADHA